MTQIKSHVLRVVVLSGLLALSGCVILDDVYDEAARSACEDEIDGKARVDCYDRADEARRERDRNQE
jgi:hypothetical protein